jgi:hypothetical protein
MKAYRGRRGTAPLILSLDSRKRVVNSTFRGLYLGERTPVRHKHPVLLHLKTIITLYHKYNFWLCPYAVLSDTYVCLLSVRKCVNIRPTHTVESFVKIIYEIQLGFKFQFTVAILHRNLDTENAYSVCNFILQILMVLKFSDRPNKTAVYFAR